MVHILQFEEPHIGPEAALVSVPLTKIAVPLQ
jgi:hypothetical protein